MEILSQRENIRIVACRKERHVFKDYKVTFQKYRRTMLSLISFMRIYRG